MKDITDPLSDPATLTSLGELSKLYPTIDHALGRLSLLTEYLTLPKGAVHVISDVHGEYKKLRHVVNNASGSLRPLVEKLFGSRLSTKDQLLLLSFIYYPREAYNYYVSEKSSAKERFSTLETVVTWELEIIRELSKHYPLEEVAVVLPSPYLQLFRELILGPHFGRGQEHVTALIKQFIDYDKDLEFLRLAARVIRNLLISELVVAGDLGDRGPRIDKAIEFISQQPRTSITWGNHDTTWMGACLGHEASIASVVRISLRYSNIQQLEEGYGISLAPLERLAQEFYGDDDAKYFVCKGKATRDELILRRMQKAISIIQFKLEDELIIRNPQFQLEHRNLLGKISRDRKNVEIDGKTYPLLDSNFPTIDYNAPNKLNEAEKKCVSSLRDSFMQSPVMWRQMQFVAKRGSMYLKRDLALIFHGCIPVDENGNFLPLKICGTSYSGKALFDAIEVSVQKAFQLQRQEDLDLLWYLWCGPNSPLFGKDKISTFENYFVESKEARHETKNPYFKLIHEKDFCKKVLNEFGMPDNGLIVNGHVPVKIEAGESPVKRSGLAVTIDGAFSEAYGDRGYTLVLDPARMYLAQHHHFDSIDDSIKNGTDMIPEITDLALHNPPRNIGDTEKGREIREQIKLLELLIRAYRENKVRERTNKAPA